MCVAPGPEHGAKETASKRHSNVEPASFDENPNVGVASLTRPDGPVSIVDSGGVMSTVIWTESLPTFSIRSNASTVNVCAPSLRSEPGWKVVWPGANTTGASESRVTSIRSTVPMPSSALNSIAGRTSLVKMGLVGGSVIATRGDVTSVEATSSWPSPVLAHSKKTPSSKAGEMFAPLPTLPPSLGHRARVGDRRAGGSVERVRVVVGEDVRPQDADAVVQAAGPEHVPDLGAGGGVEGSHPPRQIPCPSRSCSRGRGGRRRWRCRPRGRSTRSSGSRAESRPRDRSPARLARGRR